MSFDCITILLKFLLVKTTTWSVIAGFLPFFFGASFLLAALGLSFGGASFFYSFSSFLVEGFSFFFVPLILFLTPAVTLFIASVAMGF